MNNYNVILECIDEINDAIVTTEYSVATAMADSYLKMSDLFAECYDRGGDPYTIYQEASIMDMVKDKAKNDKNGFVTFFKFIPRLIIAIIEKIKTKLLNKDKGDVNVKGSDVEKANKELTKKKTGTMVAAGGFLLAATAAGGVLISKVRNKKSNGEDKKQEPEVKVEVTKESEVKTNVDVEAMQKTIMNLTNEMQKLSARVDNVDGSLTLQATNEKTSAEYFFGKTNDLQQQIATLEKQINAINSNQVNYVLKDDFDKNNQQIQGELNEFKKDIDAAQKKLSELSKNTDEKFSNLEAETGNLRNKLVEDRNAINALNRKNTENRQVMGIMYQYSKENRNAINTLNSQNAENRKAMQLMQQEINQLHARITENKKQVDAMSKQLSSTKSQANNLTSQINSLIKSINNANAENKTLSGSLSSLKSYVDVMTKSVDKLEISMKKSSAKLYALDNVVGKNASSISEIQNKLEDSISKSNDDNAKVTSEIEKIKAAITKAQNMHDKLREFVDSDRRASKKQESEIKNMKDTLEKESKQLVEMVNQFCAEFHKKELEYDKLEQHIKSSKKDNVEPTQETPKGDAEEAKNNAEVIRKTGGALSAGCNVIMRAVSVLGGVTSGVHAFKSAYAEKYGRTIESTDEENNT